MAKLGLLLAVVIKLQVMREARNVCQISVVMCVPVHGQGKLISPVAPLWHDLHPNFAIDSNAFLGSHVYYHSKALVEHQAHTVSVLPMQAFAGQGPLIRRGRIQTRT